MKKYRKGIIICLVIVLLIVLLVLDSGCRMVTSEYTVSSHNLPGSFEGFTIVQLSDLHGRIFGKDSARLVKKTAARKPDIIVITGDMVDENTGDLTEIESLLRQLRDIAPVYYVSGNHEWWAGCLPELETVFARQEVRYLKNEYVLLEQGGEAIALLGVEDPNGPAAMAKPTELVEALEAEEGEGFRVLLGHRNYWREAYPELDVDLIFCGHAHGGIVRLPFLGGLVGSNFDLFPKDVDGTAESGRYTMVVSRGLGNSVPVPRFLNNPELVVVKLKSE